MAELWYEIKKGMTPIKAEGRGQKAEMPRRGHTTSESVSHFLITKSLYQPFQPYQRYQLPPLFFQSFFYLVN
jgi:hypothetical protein